MNTNKLNKMTEQQRIDALLQAFTDTGYEAHVEEESETFRLAKHIVTQDLPLLEKATDSQELEDLIRDAASAARDKCYAELSCDEEQESEATLGWVCFGELWKVLESATGNA